MMKNMFIALAVSMAWTQVTLAADQAKAAERPEKLDLGVKVVEVLGKAQFRLDEEAKWEVLSTESKPTTGSQFRTGPKSKILLRVGSNSDVTLSGLGVLTIGELAYDREGGEIKTRMYKKYGRMRAKVEHIGDLQNDYEIYTPGATLAIRGSEVEHSGYAGWMVEGVNGTIFNVTDKGTFLISANDNSGSGNENPTTFALNDSAPLIQKPGGEGGGGGGEGGGGEGGGGEDGPSSGYVPAGGTNVLTGSGGNQSFEETEEVIEEAVTITLPGGDPF